MQVGSIPTLCTIFPIFITPETAVVITKILYKLSAVWLLRLPCICVCMYGHCLNVCNFKANNAKVMSVVVCTNLSGKKPHRQVDMDKVVASRSLGGVMVSTLAWDARDLGSIPALGAMLPIFITP